MIKKEHNLVDLKMGEENDVIIATIIHEGKKMFHCSLSEKYKLKNGNHLLDTDIVSFYAAVMGATRGKAKYFFINKGLDKLFWKVRDVQDTYLAKKGPKFLDEHPYNEVRREAAEFLISDKTFSDEHTTENLFKNFG